jgi:hypothetical protein
LVETQGWYGLGVLVRVSWSRSNYDNEVENLRRNGIAESTQDLDRQRSVVRGSKDHDHPPSNSGAIATIGSGEIQDRWIGGEVNKGEINEQEALQGTKLHGR